MSEQKDRMGTNFERMIADMFNRMGFSTKQNIFSNKENGQRSEQDVLAEKGNLKILIQCKDYAKFPDMKMEETIQDLVEDGDSHGADKLILAIIGLKDTNKWENYAKVHGVYLWNEKFWRRLQSLDLYDLIFEIGKSLEIEENLRRISKEEENDLQQIYNILDNTSSAKVKSKIFEKLHNLNLSDENKRKIQIKEIANILLLEQEKETEERGKEKVEDIEFEELFRLINSSNLDYSKRYSTINKIAEISNLSEKSKRILAVEKIKTFLEKQQNDSESEIWGDKRYIELEKLMNEGLLSENDKRRIQEEIGQNIGISKKGYTESQKVKIERIIKNAILKKKIIKTLISIGIWVVITVILWRILF